MQKTRGRSYYSETTLKLSILYLRCGDPQAGYATAEAAGLSILYLRCIECPGGSAKKVQYSFNSLFEMQNMPPGLRELYSAWLFQFSI